MLLALLALLAVLPGPTADLIDRLVAELHFGTGLEDPPPVYHPDAVVREPEERGEHWRFESWNGPVHVWRPAGYDPTRARVVLYVHGFYIDVDRAWKEHRLARQFAESGVNALFIAPEAPTASGQEVRWPGPHTLLVEVEKHTGIAIPPGPVIACGHSGAYRTLAMWLDYLPLTRVIILDGLNGHEDLYLEWLKDPAHHLTLVVGEGSFRVSKKFLEEKDLRRLVVYMPAIPDSPKRFGRRHKKARLLHLKSQFGHFDLITEGKAIPVLLGM